tara:strand:+ start:610 stop:1554 length:945 start_codon:yes stop_codon:yes gene_type:complete
MSRQAFLFPGQASQAVGMAKDLCDNYASVSRRFAEAEDFLCIPLRKLCFEGPLEELSQTAVTQPAVFVHSVAVAELLIERGIEPVCTAGHSLGEYSALTIAGVFEFPLALELVSARGRLMQEASEKRPGTMAAIIGLDETTILQLCGEVAPEGSVVPANFNAPDQVIVSGTLDAVTKVANAADSAGAKRVVPLQVSGAFHSKLMASAAQEMADRLNDIDMLTPKVPVVTNVGAIFTENVDVLRQQLLQQILSPVRWTECVKAIAAAGLEFAIEVGPGTVLKGLVRRIHRKMTVATAGTVADIEYLINERAEKAV